MRKIEFRGKKVGNGEWVYGFYSPLIWYPSFEQTPSIKTFKGTDIEVDKDTVGEYTGLKDKNAKEIYEGDIVKWYNELLVVKYGEFITTRESNELSRNFKEVQTFGWYGERQLSYAKNQGIEIDVVRYGEVIGNIFDNGELLNED